MPPSTSRYRARPSRYIDSIGEENIRLHRCPNRRRPLATRRKETTKHGLNKQDDALLEKNPKNERWPAVKWGERKFSVRVDLRLVGALHIESPLNVFTRASIGRGLVSQAASFAAKMVFVLARMCVCAGRKRAAGGSTGRVGRAAFLASPNKREAVEGDHAKTGEQF